MTKELREKHREMFHPKKSYNIGNRQSCPDAKYLLGDDIYYVNYNPDLDGRYSHKQCQQEMDEMDDWAVEYLTGEYIIYRGSGFFTIEEDAVLFKLRWAG